ncbi:UDP-N-acetylmuramoyl-tripeptide--D-alanyl-D-alanine ligase [Flavobacteriaceae bacterium AU392]|nr:UDP-N-acetylmuramoyl-tripeptide--D-alanyl-D-alanine ligase [Flavobacteriaceae bacterium]RKM82635.1 UDP-N-acetylmuramoyl-tripeptide--D-alanyl-D-alanine ligase [Flavobacteriaceae bacterium AU392]
MNIKELHLRFLESQSISTDTRKVVSNDLFFALKGDNFNGNQFAAQALEKGAKYAIIDEELYVKNSNYILVPDVLKTLQQLASYHRDYLGLKIIALTGSNGKTTTKELIHKVLKQRYRTVATIGNLNNHIGVPLTLLSMDKTTEVGIVEMGANHLEEIAFLCSIAKPNYGYITNFGKAHLEGFGSIEGIVKGKSELYNYLISNNEYVFFNADDAIQSAKLNSYINKFGFSQADSNYYNVILKETNPFVRVQLENMSIDSNLIGDYNFTNICASIIIGKYFNVPINNIKKAIEAYTPDNNRSQIIEKASNKIIMDAYNANPTSMTAAIDNFSNLKSDQKIAILGDMFELGHEAEIEHQALVNHTSKLNIDIILLVGENFYKTLPVSENIQKFQNFEALKLYLDNEIFKNSTILIKGSRGMALERVLELI